MRINVYNEELTGDVEVVSVAPRPGKIFIGVRFFLKSPPELHHKPEDDDRSAVTFWLGSRAKASTFFVRALEELAMIKEGQ